MNLKKLNEIFGYGFFILGALKILLLILSVLQIVSSIMAITNGEVTNFEYYSILAKGIGILEMFLIVGSLIMIFLNKKQHPEVIKGYLYGIGACFLPTMGLSNLSIYFLSAECILYIKAGNKVRNRSTQYNYLYKTSKQMIQDTEWFYSDKNEENK